MAQNILFNIKMEGSDKVIKNLEDITAKQIEQQEAVKQTQAEIKAYEKELAAVNKTISESKVATAEDVKQQQELTSAITNSKVVLASQKDGLADVNKQRRDMTGLIKANNTYLEAELGSNEQLRAQLKILTAEYDAMSQAERENADTGGVLAQRTKEISDKLKENESAIGDNRRNVGNYEEAITSALGKVNLFGVNLGEVTNQIRNGIAEGNKLIQATLAQAQAQTAAATATKGATTANGGFATSLRVVKIALIGLGIGAIVIAIGALIAAFASTQRGADALSRRIEPLKAIFQSMIGVVQDISFKIADAFNKPQETLKAFGDLLKSQVINRLTAAREVALGLINLDFKRLGNGIAQGVTGVENLSDKVKNASNQTKDFLNIAAAKGKQIAELQIQLEKSRTRLLGIQDDYEDKERALLLISKDTSKSFAERKKASDAIIANAQKLAQEEKAVKQIEIGILAIKQSLNDTDRAGKEEMKKLTLELGDIDDKVEEKKIEQLRVQAGERKEQADIAKAANAEELKRLEAVADINRTENERLEKQTELKLQELGLNREDAKLTAAELQAKKKLTDDLNLAINKSNNERIEQLNKITETEKEQLASSFNAKLEELELVKNESEFTAQELEARKVLFEEYYKDLEKLHLQNLNKEIEQQAKSLSAENTALERNYYNDLVAYGNNEEEKKRITEKYNKDKLNSLANTLRSEIQTIEAALNPLVASTGDGIADAILSDDAKAELTARLAEVQAALSKTNYEYNQIGISPETGKAVTLGSLLGANEEDAALINSTYASLSSSITSIMQSANEAIAMSTAKRISEVDEQLKRGTISEKEAEKKKSEIRKEEGKKQQAISIALATVQLAEGTIAAITGAMTLGNPIVGAIVGAAAVAALVATYGVNIAKIKSQKFAEGGFVSGAGTATSDSIPAMLSNGEFVQPADATNYYGTEFMEAIRKKQLPKNAFAAGGLVVPTPINNTSSQIERGLQPLANRIESQRIEVIQTESKFTKIQKQVSNVEASGTY